MMKSLFKSNYVAWITCGVLLTLLLPPAATAATSVTKGSITWTFDGDYTVGQYVTGDYWVEGPVTITAITQPAATAGRDGSMINPEPKKSTNSQGYDSRVGGYSAALNVSLSLPLVVTNGSSLVSGISRNPTETARANYRPALEVAEVLTVVASAPAATDFRPPYAGADKLSYSSLGMQTNLLLSLTPVASTPSLASVAGIFDKPWIDHVLEWQGDDMHPRQNLPNYGGGIARDTSIGALRLLLDDDPEDKYDLLIGYVQLGIDNYGLVLNGGNWGDVGGTIGVGRKLPILFAGLMLDEADLLNVASTYNTRVKFQEDHQTAYLTQAIRDMTYHEQNCSGSADYCNPGYYDNTPIGTPVWVERGYKSEKDSGYNYVPGKLSYRGITHMSTKGTALAVRLLGLETKWNYDPFLDWTDERVEAGQTGTWGSVFCDDMYVTHRDAALGGEETTVAPVFSVPGGLFVEPVSVTASSGSLGATIRYTDDASVPDGGSPVLSDALNLTGTTTLRAFALKEGLNPSPETVATYNFGPWEMDDTWSNASFTTRTSDFTLSFLATPLEEGIDNVIGLGDGPADAFADLAAQVRFAPAGIIDVRNGGSYAADAVLNYSTNTSYRVYISVDVTAKTYDVVVIPSGGPPVALASNYAFRAERAELATFSNFAFIATTAKGSVRLEQVEFVQRPARVSGVVALQ